MSLRSCSFPVVVGLWAAFLVGGRALGADAGEPRPGDVVFQKPVAGGSKYGHVGIVDLDRGDGPHVIDNWPETGARRVPLDEWASHGTYVGSLPSGAGGNAAAAYAYEQYAGGQVSFDLLSHNCTHFVAKAFAATGNPIGAWSSGFLAVNTVTPSGLWNLLGGTGYLTDAPPVVLPTTTPQPPTPPEPPPTPSAGGTDTTSPPLGSIESRPLWLAGPAGAGLEGAAQAAKLLHGSVPDVEGLIAMSEPVEAKSNAIATAGWGFFGRRGRQAAFFGALTHADTYDHSYVTCQRFHGHSLVEVGVFKVDGHLYTFNVMAPWRARRRG